MKFTSKYLSGALVAALIGSIFSAGAAEKKVQETKIVPINPSLQENCPQLLTELIRNTTYGGRVLAGKLSDLPELLRTANLKDPQIQVIQAGFNFLQTLPTADPILKEVLTDLNESGNDPKFFLCLMNSGCKIRNSPAHHQHLGVDPNFWTFTRTLDGIIESELQPRLREANEKLLDHRLKVLLMDIQGDKLEAWYHWISALIHEAAHYSEPNILSEWVEALLYLDSQSQPLDDYDSHVLISDNRLFLEDSFMNIWKESRAYRAQWYAFQALYKNIAHATKIPKYVSRQNERVAEKYFRDAFAYQMREIGITETQLDAFGIDRNQPWDFALKATEVMRATIERARALKLKE